MSHTSSERGYRRSLGIALVTLVVLCAGLFAVSAAQGPKLGDVQLDLDRASTQQLRLVANQPLEAVDPSQVTVTPIAPFTVDTAGNVIAVVFSSALDYDTEYTVRVSGVRSPTRDIESSFETSFSTKDATVFYLDRTGDTDRIFESGITPPERTLAFEAEMITEFALVGRTLAVVTRDANLIDSLSLVQLGTARVESIPLPDDGWVTEVQASDSAQTLGFVLTSVGGDRYSRALFTIDLVAGRQLRPTTDLSGEPLHVLDWSFRPGTETMVVLDSSRALAVIDPVAPEAQLPLGDYLTLSHLSEDGSTATVSDQLGFSTLTIDSLLDERIAPDHVDGNEPYLGEAQVLTNGLLQHVYSYYAETNRFDSYLVLKSDATSKVLFGEKGATAVVMHFTVSPNEQYVAVEVDPGNAGSQDDGYLGSSRPTDVTTYVLELATGETVASFAGFALDW